MPNKQGDWWWGWLESLSWTVGLKIKNHKRSSLSWKKSKHGCWQS